MLALHIYSTRALNLRALQGPLRSVRRWVSQVESTKTSQSTTVTSTVVSPGGEQPGQSSVAEKKTLTVTERDAAIMSAFKDREGTLANAELENGQLEEGFRKNVEISIPRNPTKWPPYTERSTTN